jgi:hypothetical protein
VTYIKREQLRELAEYLAPHVAANPIIDDKGNGHILRIRGVFKRHAPYVLRFDVIADAVGGVRLGVGVLPFYAMYDSHSVYTQTVLPHMSSEETLVFAKQLLKFFASEVSLTQGLPGTLDSKILREWLLIHGNKGEVLVDEYMKEYNL